MLLPRRPAAHPKTFSRDDAITGSYSWQLLVTHAVATLPQSCGKPVLQQDNAKRL